MNYGEDHTGHVWQLFEVIADHSGARLLDECSCGAVSIEPSRADAPRQVPEEWPDPAAPWVF